MWSSQAPTRKWESCSWFHYRYNKLRWTSQGGNKYQGFYSGDMMIDAWLPFDPKIYNILSVIIISSCRLYLHCICEPLARVQVPRPEWAPSLYNATFLVTQPSVGLKMQWETNWSCLGCTWEHHNKSTFYMHAQPVMDNMSIWRKHIYVEKISIVFLC